MQACGAVCRSRCRAVPVLPAGAVTPMKNVVLGDDHGIFLDALSTVLEMHGFEVHPVTRSPAEMIAVVQSQRPDACLIDRDFGTDECAETVRKVAAASPATSVIVVSANPCAKAADRALAAGASGYLHQSRGVDALVSALERVLGGEVVVDLPAAKPQRRPREYGHAFRLAAGLTRRERECLAMLVEGLDTTAMVARLGVARTTVRTHLQSVLTKLCVHSRLEAAAFAVRHRLLEAWSHERQPAAAARPQPSRHAAEPRLRAAGRHLAAVPDRAQAKAV
jgi:two-component system nitrate/nitrite response regulator NarL